MSLPSAEAKTTDLHCVEVDLGDGVVESVEHHGSRPRKNLQTSAYPKHPKQTTKEVQTRHKQRKTTSLRPCDEKKPMTTQVLTMIALSREKPALLGHVHHDWIATGYRFDHIFHLQVPRKTHKHEAFFQEATTMEAKSSCAPLSLASCISNLLALGKCTGSPEPIIPCPAI